MVSTAGLAKFPPLQPKVPGPNQREQYTVHQPTSPSAFRDDIEERSYQTQRPRTDTQQTVRETENTLSFQREYGALGSEAKVGEECVIEFIITSNPGSDQASSRVLRVEMTMNLFW